MVVTVHIAAATQTIPSYAPCGAIVHSHLAHELVVPPNVVSVGLAVFGGLPVFPSEDTRTTEHATLVAIAHIDETMTTCSSDDVG